MSSNKRIQFRSSLELFTLIASIGLLATGKSVRGQEALRMSMAGDLAAESQQQANSSIGYYNLLAGPTAWRLFSGFGVEFNDNIRLQQNGESDLIVRPSMSVQLHWPITLKNSLDVSLGAGYSDYLQNQDLSQFFINPGSGLSFDVYVGDFKLNLHDRITITEYSFQDPGVNGNSQDLVSLENTAGISALADLNKLVVNFGYDHVNYTSLSQSQNSQPDATSENIFINSGVRVRPELMLGLEAGGTVITYSQPSSTNSPAIPGALQWSVGAFGSAKISDYLDVRVDAGYTDYVPDNTSANLLTQDSSGLYFSLTLSHRVNRFLNYTLDAGHSTDLSAFGQAQSYYYVRLSPNWNLFQKYSLSTPITWQQGTRIYNSTAGGVADYTQIGLGLNVTRSLTQHLSASADYQWVDETSNQTGLAYMVNIVSLNFMYQF